MDHPLRDWPRWSAIAAAAWSAVYTVLGVRWATGGTGFPFGLENDPAADVSILAWARTELAAPVLASVCGIGVLAALGMALGRRPARPIRVALLGYAWTFAVLLTLVIPDFRVLALVAYSLVAVVAVPLGLLGPAELVEAFTWPIVNQFILILGGLIWAAAALGFRRRSTGACVLCGHRNLMPDWARPDAAARWGAWATYVAMAIPVFYGVTRLAWAFGIPLGISTEFLREGQQSGLWQVGAGLGVFAIAGAALTWGLIRPWGQVFPRWAPIVGGRRVPPALAIVPAGLVAILVTSAGLMYVRLALFGGLGMSEDLPFNLDENWATIAPELLWPLWGVALGAATLGYHLRRRPAECDHTAERTGLGADTGG